MLQQKIYNYFHQNLSLKIFFVFDDEGNALGDEVSAIEWAEGCRFVEFDNNCFYTQYRLEKEWANEKVILHLQQLAPQNKEAILHFPLLDSLKANMKLERDDCGAFMQQFRISEKWARFVQRHILALQSRRSSGAFESVTRIDINVANP